MNTKWFLQCAVVLALVGSTVLRAQEPAATPSPDPSHTSAGPGADSTTAKVLGPPALSDWLTYTKPDCCGPMGCDGPIKSELYVRTGFNLVTEGEIFGHVLELGWAIQGGGRALFFDPARDAAWTFDLGLTHIRNGGNNQDITFTINFGSSDAPIPATASIRELNRTYVNLSLGREWFLDSLWRDSCWKCRAGCEVGGRYGTAKIEFNEFSHKTDILGGPFLSLHSDCEYPWGCCIFMAGFRAEWAYNWSTMLQPQNDADFQDVNLLFNFGVRF